MFHGNLARLVRARVFAFRFELLTSLSWVENSDKLGRRCVLDHKGKPGRLVQMLNTNTFKACAIRREPLSVSLAHFAARIHMPGKPRTLHFAPLHFHRSSSAWFQPALYAASYP